MIGLPDRIGTVGLPAVDQVETPGVRLAALVCQGHERGREVVHDAEIPDVEKKLKEQRDGNGLTASRVGGRI